MRLRREDELFRREFGPVLALVCISVLNKVNGYFLVVNVVSTKDRLPSALTDPMACPSYKSHPAQNLWRRAESG